KRCRKTAASVELLPVAPISVGILFKLALLAFTKLQAARVDELNPAGTRYASATISLSRYGVRKPSCERLAAGVPYRFSGISLKAAKVTGCRPLPFRSCARYFKDLPTSVFTRRGERRTGLNMDTPRKISPPKAPVIRTGANKRA